MSAPSPESAESDEVRVAELALFTRQLGAMLDAGVDILRALRIASQHAGNARLTAAVREIVLRLEDGREFHQAIAPHPDLFDPFYVEMARQGEADGLLGKALLAVADYLDGIADRLPPDAPARVSTAARAFPEPPVVWMTVLGIQALGVAGFWGFALLRPEWLPPPWVGPLAALWCAVSLLGGAHLLHHRPRLRPLPPLPLPKKSAERRKAETEAVVRNALLEQEEDAAAEPSRETVKEAPPPHPNGRPGDPQPPGAASEQEKRRFRL